MFIYSKQCEQKHLEATTCFYLLMEIYCWLHCGFHFNIHYLFVYLFKAMSTKAGGTDHLFLFTYANHFIVRHGFRFNIQYLFVYLFKAMSTKAGGSRPPVFIYLWIIGCWSHVVFVWIFSIYFVYLFKVHVNKSCASHYLFLFTYGNCVLHYMWQIAFNIQCLWVYVASKRYQRKQVEATTCLCFDLCK